MITLCRMSHLRLTNNGKFVFTTISSVFMCYINISYILIRLKTRPCSAFVIFSNWYMKSLMGKCKIPFRLILIAMIIKIVDKTS